jgi:3-deoxy-D-manno-octulosonic-acid transferase
LYAPFDFSFSVKKFFKKIKPKLLAICEIEVWPNLIMEAFTNDIPIILINGRMPEKDFKNYKRVRFFFRDIFKLYSLILVQDERFMDLYMQLGAPRDKIILTGNTKFDMDIPLLKDNDLKKLSEELGLYEDEKVLLCGSTHKGEEEIILDAFLPLKKKHPNLRLIIAPRHMERVEELEKLISQKGLPFRRRTCKTAFKDKSEVIIIDTVGELTKLYQLATIVFVGGSLVPVGGHNIIEPALCKKPIIFGRFMNNFEYIKDSVLQNKGAIQVKDKDELKFQIDTLLRNQNLRCFLAERSYEVVVKNKGASEVTAGFILERLRG